MIDLSAILKDKVETVESSIKTAAFERDSSATPMESQHDQSRQIANQLYNSLLEELRSWYREKDLLGVENENIIGESSSFTDTVNRILKDTML